MSAAIRRAGVRAGQRRFSTDRDETASFNTGRTGILRRVGPTTGLEHTSFVFPFRPGPSCEAHVVGARIRSHRTGSLVSVLLFDVALLCCATACARFLLDAASFPPL